jgi:hypothetical protein
VLGFAAIAGALALLAVFGRPPKKLSSQQAIADHTLPAHSTQLTSERTDRHRNSDQVVPAVALARAALEQALPQWGEEINRVPAHVARSTFDPARFNALELAKRVSSEKFAFSKVRANGRTVYKSADGNSTVKVDTKIGYWKLISPIRSTPTAPTDPSIFTDGQAAERQEQLLEKFEVPKDQVGETHANGIASAGREEGTLLHGRYVTTDREINGLPVEGSTFSTTYNLDGSVAWLERRWPKFELDSRRPVTSRERAVAEIAAQLASVYETSPESVKVLSKLVYAYDEASGEHRPELRVAVERTGVVDGEILKSVEYYLTKEPTEARSDTPTDG